MEHNIGVGAIVGLVIASSFYIYNSNKFNSTQKTILLICIIFPPAQWLGILIVSAYNNYIENNSVEKVTERKIEQNTNTLNSQVESLKDLKEKGILTEEEYSQKVNRIEQEKKEQNLKNSTEYKQLKSLFDSGVLTKEEFENKVGLLNLNSIVKIDKTLNNKIETDVYKVDYLDFLKSLFIVGRWAIGIFLIVGSTILGPLDQGLDNFDEVSVFQLILGLLLLPITTDYIKKIFLKKAK